MAALGQQQLLTGRSHRAAVSKAQLVEVAERSRKLLSIPADYRIGIVAGSDTGAFEAAMWSMLGARAVDVFAWDVFGRDWLIDIQTQLTSVELHAHTAPFGQLPDLTQAKADHDIVFTWNGTTAGVRVPNADWIPADRQGLVFCDAISAIFAMDMPFDKMDVITWSWQKGMGGEAQHGMIALSPRALERLKTYKPAWPLPKIFRLAQWIDNDLLFTGDTINTPSMLCVADALDALDWAESVTHTGLIARTEANARLVWDWAANSTWADLLASDPATRSTTAHCLTITDPRFTAFDESTQRRFIRTLVAMLEAEGVAFDIAGHREAPPCLRLWTGPTVETADVAAVLPWLDWAFAAIWQDFA